MCVYSLSAEDAEGRTGDVTERRFRELRRMLSDRVRSEASQRETESREKDSKIHELQTTLANQLQKISELEEKVEDTMSRSQRQTIEQHSEREALLSEDDKTIIIEPQSANETNSEKGKKSRIQNDEAQTSKSQSTSHTENDPSTMKVKEKIQYFEKVNEDNQVTPVHGQRLPAGKISCRRKLSFLVKRQPSRTSIK